MLNDAPLPRRKSLIFGEMLTYGQHDNVLHGLSLQINVMLNDAPLPRWNHCDLDEGAERRSA